MEKENKYQYEIVLDEEMVAGGDTSHTLILKQIKEGSHVLECGPGGGVMTRYLKENLHCMVTILEIDRKSFRKAIRYADLGFCVNLEKDEWMTKLEDESFDYILYADVLEHLHDPTNVLKKMQRFLKPDGRVILSVPNVAFGDIVMNLMRDQFNYTELGLLDNTHVHLFARDSLHTMIKEAGYYLEYETCKTLPLFNSEQAKFLKDADKEELKDALVSHSNRYVYQFICRLSKTETRVISDVALQNKMLEESDTRIQISTRKTKATCFLNYGEGYSKENSISVDYSASGRMDLVFDIPEGVVSIRFDPVEGYFCIIQNLEFFSNCGFLTYRNINGNTIGNLELFCTTDPQIQINCTRTPRRLHVRGNICFFDDPVLIEIMSSCISENQKRIEAENEQKRIDRELTASIGEQKRIENELNIAKEEHERLVNELDKEKAEHERLENELGIVTTENERLENELAVTGKEKTQLNDELVKVSTDYGQLSKELIENTEKIEQLDSENKRLQKSIEEADSNIAGVNKQLEQTKKQYATAIKQREQLKIQVIKWRESFNIISNSACWKMTKPIRMLLDFLKKFLFFQLIEKTMKCWKDHGLKYTLVKIKGKIPRRNKTKEELEKQVKVIQAAPRKEGNEIKKDNTSNIKQKKAEIQNRNISAIRNSEYFDAEYYLRNNIGLQGKNIDLAQHYLKYGGFELRDPSISFCSEEYYYLHEDVKKARINPLLHYELFGKWENRELYGFEEKAFSFPEGTVEIERIYPPAPVVHRRAVVLSCFFGDGFIPDTLLYLIRGLHEAADQIMLVGDCLIFPEELDKLEGLVIFAKFKRHEQYDFGSYKRGLEFARKNGYLDNSYIDELIFMNDSCYGPVFPFSESLDRMSERTNDFWGISDYQSFNRAHISTYFSVFKRRVIDSYLLDSFLQRVKGTYDRGRVIATLETELTVYLEQNGMRWELLATEEGKNLFNYPVTFLKKYRVPLVKKKAFSRRGKESQEEAIQIIRENAPELAEMIHFEPFTPKEHHFPTLEEHSLAFKDICKTIYKKIQNGEKIKALFLVFNPSFFASKPLYTAMLADNLFDPYIAVIPDRRWGTEKQIQNMEICESMLLCDGIEEQRIIRVQKDEVDRWPDICDDVDIVCYNSPYNLTSFKYLPRYSIGRSFLPIMVNYGFYRSKYDDKILAMSNYTYLWKAFFECEDTLQQYKENSRNKGINGEIVGYIKMDPLAQIKPEKHERKRIFIALHHSVEGGINQDLELGNFVRYSEYFFNLPDHYPTIEFVYRPHPHLWQVLSDKKLWTEQQINDYIRALKAKNNVIWSNGDDYFKEFAESDGCIQDCGSFLVEYLFTGKPCCYMLKNPSDIDDKFAPLGKKCLEQCYISYDTDAIDSFIEKVIIEGNDEKAEAREEFAKTVMVNYPHAAEAAIESIKKDIYEAGSSEENEEENEEEI